MKQTGNGGGFEKFPCKPDLTAPGLSSCYGMILKWAKVIDMDWFLSEFLEKGKNSNLITGKSCYYKQFLPVL